MESDWTAAETGCGVRFGVLAEGNGDNLAGGEVRFMEHSVILAEENAESTCFLNFVPLILANTYLSLNN